MDQLDSNNIALLLSAALIVVGVLSSVVAMRFGAPLLFLFLVIGMLAGENGPGGIRFDDFAGAHLVGSAALAIILFDGGLRTKLRALKEALAPAGLLATVGVLVTTGIVGLAAMPLLGLSLPAGLLLGAIVASTDAAAVFFLLRSGGLRLRRRVNDTLEVESSTNDPFAVFLVIAIVTYMQSNGWAGGALWLVFVQHMVIGTIGGLAGGLLLSMTINRTALPTGLTAVLVTGSTLLIFAATNVLHGSGFLAAYIAGLVMGNRATRAVAGVTSFTDAATWLAQLIMFVLLGLLATPSRLLAVALPALGVALVLMLVARPIAVALCLAPFRFRNAEKAFVAWVGLRGAVAIFLATIPVLAGLPAAMTFFDVAFFVVLTSLVVQGWTIRPAAQFLGVALPGADHPESRTELDLPGQLEQELVGYPVLLESAYLRHPLLPSWAKLVLIVRGERILLPDEAGAVVAGDYVYLLAPPMRASGLDRLFTETERERTEEEVYFGEFVLPGSTSLREIAQLYAPELSPPNQSVADAFARALGTPTVGDTLPLGPIELVAKSLEHDRVVEIGVRLEPEPVTERARRLARRLRLARERAA